MNRLLSEIAGIWFALTHLGSFVRVVCAAARGRFFYFRDEPQDVVEFFAAWAGDDTMSNDLQRIATEARDELLRRQRRAAA